MTPTDALLNTIAANHGLELAGKAKTPATANTNGRKRIEEDDALSAQQSSEQADVTADAGSAQATPGAGPILLAQSDTGAPADQAVPTESLAGGAGTGTTGSAGAVGDNGGNIKLALGGLALGGIALAAGGGGGGGGGGGTPVDSQAPIFSSNAITSVAENTDASTVIHTVHASDNVGVAGYSLAGGADDGKFTLDPTTGELRFKASPDFETPASAAGSNTYTVKVKATDAAGNGTEQTVTVNVADVAETTTLIGTASIDTISFPTGLDDFVITGLAGNDIINIGVGNDIVRPGDGADTVNTGAGNDIVVVVGQTAASQYIQSDIYNPGGSGIDLSGVVSLADLNGRDMSEVVAGESIDGGAGTNRLIVYGNVDFTGVNLANITEFQVNSTLTVTAQQLNALGLGLILGDGESTLNITNPAGTPVIVDLSGVEFADVLTLNIGPNVTLIVDQADVDSLRYLAGEGTLKASSGTGALSLNGRYTTLSVQDSAGIVDASHGGANYVNGKLLIGSESDETLSGGANNDRLEGGAGNDNLLGGDGNDVLRGGAGVDAMDGGAGNDRFVVVGDISGGGKVNSAEDTASLGFPLTSLNFQNLNEDAGGAVETIRGGDGDDTLYVYGTADLSNYDISGIENIEIRSNVVFDAAFLASCKKMNGDGSSFLSIQRPANDTGPLVVDLTASGAIQLSNIGQIQLGPNVILKIGSLDDLGGANILSGNGKLEYAGVNVLNIPEDFVLTSGLSFSSNITGGDRQYDKVIHGIGPINGSDGNDLLIGSSAGNAFDGGMGNDTYQGKEKDDGFWVGIGNKEIFDSGGNDWIQVSKGVAGTANVNLQTGGTVGNCQVTIGAGTQIENFDATAVGADAALDVVLQDTNLDNEIYCSGGDDKVTVTGGKDCVVGGSGNDTLICENANVHVAFVGGDGDDCVVLPWQADEWTKLGLQIDYDRANDALLINDAAGNLVVSAQSVEHVNFRGANGGFPMGDELPVSFVADQARRTEFNIDFLISDDTLAPEMLDVLRGMMEEATNRWERIITADIPNYNSVDDLLIVLETDEIDGIGDTLATSSGRLERVDASGGLPYISKITVDKSDLSPTGASREQIDVLIHEIGHSLGLRGGFFKSNDLLSADADYRYIGSHGLEKYQEAVSLYNSSKYNDISYTAYIPLESAGGDGTAGSHFAEKGNRPPRNINLFGKELMSGYYDNPSSLSPITFGVLEDLGYTVDYSMGDKLFWEMRNKEMPAFTPTSKEVFNSGWGRYVVEKQENAEFGDVAYIPNANSGLESLENSMTYTLLGRDRKFFTINEQTGKVSFSFRPDYEKPADATANNQYDLIIRATNVAGNSTDHKIWLKITDDSNEDTTAPTFSSGASVTVAENIAISATVYDATADGDSGVSYTLGGTDSALFNIDASTGAITFKTSPNFEVPTDAGSNNVYNFTVTAVDGSGNASDQAVALSVTDIAETSQSVAGDAVIDLGVYGKLIAPVQVEGNWYYFWDLSGDGTSAGGDTTSHYELDGIFTQDINGNTGGGGNTDNTYRYATLEGVHLALPTANGGMAYPGGINGYQPGTAVADGTTNNGTYDELLAIWDAHNGAATGTGISDAPSGWQSSGYWSATPSASGHAHVHFFVGGVYDEDDFYGGYVALQVLETVAPVFSSDPSASVAENAAASAAVYDATADGDVGVSYSLSGTDSALFNINASTGVVTFKASPNYEAPADAGGNNVYDFVVTATDGSGNTANQAVALSVTDVAENTYTLGQLEIDLKEYGKLIAPVQVEGNWYYFWDRNGNGASDEGDVSDHNSLDGIFTQDINGNTNSGNDTTDVYRYATLSDIKLALPTANGGMGYPNGIDAYQTGTPVQDGATNNPMYDELLAIWDAYNGAGTDTSFTNGASYVYGAPSGWQNAMYWSATPSALGHVEVVFVNGYVAEDSDINVIRYTALQVL